MRRSSLFWGLILVLFGILLLLETQGFLDALGIDLWNLVWPVFLILLGLWMLWGNFFRGGAIAEETFALPTEGASRGQIRFNHGAGRLTIHSGASPENVIEGKFSGGLEHRAQISGETIQLDLRVPPNSVFFFPFSWGPGFSKDWDVRLNPELLLALDLKTGANDARLDLQDLKITDLRLSTGASATDIRMPANAGHTQVKIESGAASVSIELPPQVAARVQASGGLADINIDQQRFPRSGNVYQSLDYQTAANHADIVIETGVGSVKIR